MEGKMIKSIIKRYHWYAVYKDGPARVRAAQWFLNKMQQATNQEEVKFYWGTGSDLLYYMLQNVTDRDSQIRLNAIGEQMFRKCESVGIYATSTPPFKLD